MTLPVGVYVGKNSVGVAPKAVGGQAANCELIVWFRMVPAPAPPVIHAERVGAGYGDIETVNPFSDTNDVQAPATVRGFSGIQPCSSPNW